MDIKQFIQDLEDLFADKKPSSEASSENKDEKKPDGNEAKASDEHKAKDRESLFRKWGKLTTDFLKRVLLAPLSFTYTWLKEELIYDLKKDAEKILYISILLILFAGILIIAYFMLVLMLVAYLWESQGLSISMALFIGFLSQFISLLIILLSIRILKRRMRTGRFIHKMEDGLKQQLPKKKV